MKKTAIAIILITACLLFASAGTSIAKAKSRANHEQVTSKLCTDQNQIKAVRKPQQVHLLS